MGKLSKTETINYLTLFIHVLSYIMQDKENRPQNGKRCLTLLLLTKEHSMILLKTSANTQLIYSYMYTFRHQVVKEQL